MTKSLWITFLLIQLTFLTGCIHEQIVIPEKSPILFSFDENEHSGKLSDVKHVESIMFIGTATRWDDSVTAWHQYHFNDEGILPDLVKGDGIWTMEISLPEGENTYKFKVKGTDSDGKEADEDIKDPNNSLTQGSDSVIYVIARK